LFLAKVAVAMNIHQTIVREVSSWPGVTTGRHRFGGTEFRLGHRELGHLHGNRLADLPFPLLIRDELVARGKAEPHHIFPESGWVSYFIQDETDVVRVVDLFRLNYERPWKLRNEHANL
jgi:luciferase-like monooxygenase